MYTYIEVGLSLMLVPVIIITFALLLKEPSQGQ